MKKSLFAILPIALLLVVAHPTSATPTPEHYTYYETDTFFAPHAAPACDSDAQTALIDMVNRAHTSLEMAAYAVGCPLLVDALIAADGRGVRVRVVSETDNSTHHLYGVQLQRLIDAGIPVRLDDSSGMLMHNKFVIRDEVEVFTGTGNLTPNGFTLHINHWLAFNSGCVSGLFFQEFEELWGGDFGRNEPTYDGLCVMDNGAEVEVFFSPSDRTQDAIMETIGNAQESIRFMTFFFTADSVADALISRHSAGLDVRGAIDHLGGSNSYSEDERLCDSGINTTTWQRPGLLHVKSAVFDTYTDNPVVWIGSHNWTAAAEERNQEASVRITGDHSLARKVRSLFNTIEFLTPDEWTCDGQDGDYSLPLRQSPVAVDLCTGIDCPSVWSWLFRAMCGEEFDCFTRIMHDGHEWGTDDNYLNVQIEDGEWSFCGADGCNVIGVDSGVIVKQRYEVGQ